MKHERKAFKFDLKETNDEAGTFVGYASVFGNVDQGGDVVVKGAFKRTLEAHQSRIKMLWNHDYKSPPIGISTVKEDEHGLLNNGKLFYKDMERARDVYTGIKNGAIDAMSFMYDVIQSEPGMKDGMRVRFLKELKLFETSPVNFPMNESAVITGVKEEDVPALLERLAKFEKYMEDYDPAGMKEFLSGLDTSVKALHQKIEGLGKATPENGEPANEKDVNMVKDLVADISARVSKMAGDSK